MDHRLDKEDELPEKFKQRQVPVAYEDEINRQVDEML